MLTIFKGLHKSHTAEQRHILTKDNIVKSFNAIIVPHVLHLQVHIHVTDLHTMRKHCSPIVVSCARC